MISKVLVMLAHGKVLFWCNVHNRRRDKADGGVDTKSFWVSVGNREVHSSNAAWTCREVYP